MQAIQPNKLMSRVEVETFFGLSRRFLEIAAVRGDGPSFIKIGRLARYRARDIEDYIEARRVRSTSDTRRFARSKR